MKNLKIAICLPSKNEEDSIGSVLQKIDEGLCMIGKPEHHLIVNVDSDSSDRTVEIFKSVPTKCPKLSLKTNYGKGGNIREFLTHVTKKNFAAFGTFDTDLISLQPDWVVGMAKKVIQENFDYVVPDYQRSPFEGSTTNQFCLPIIYGFFGKMIRQPIGGDFFFSRRFGEKILEKIVKPPTVEILDYGIDIFFTLIALSEGFSIGTAFLNQKIHKPSHFKMEKMFQQVAQSTFVTIRTIGISHPKASPSFTKPEDSRLVPMGSYSQREFAKELKKKNLEFIQNNQKTYAAILGEIFESVKNCFLREQLTSEIWIHLLHKFIKRVMNDEMSISLLTSYLTPLFLLRAVTYWDQAAALTPWDAEEEICAQSIHLRKLLIQ